MSKKAETKTTRLGIAGITLAISSAHEGLINDLSKKYENFPAVGEAALHIQVYMEEPQRDVGANTEIRVDFSSGSTRFSAPGYHGIIDENENYGEVWISHPNPRWQVEYVTRLAYATLAINRGGFLFHGAGVVRSGGAYVFFGPSGSGKTTVARLSAGSTILNDDLLVLLPVNAEWFAFATPFWNPTQVQPVAGFAPVVGLFRLAQDINVYLETMNTSLAMAEVLANIPVVTQDPERNPRLISAVSTLLAAVPSFRLHFKKDDSFWYVIDSSTQALDR